MNFFTLNSYILVNVIEFIYKNNEKCEPPMEIWWKKAN